MRRTTMGAALRERARHSRRPAARLRHGRLRRRERRQLRIIRGRFARQRSAPKTELRKVVGSDRARDARATVGRGARRWRRQVARGRHTEHRRRVTRARAEHIAVARRWHCSGRNNNPAAAMPACRSASGRSRAIERRVHRHRRMSARWRRVQRRPRAGAGKRRRRAHMRDASVALRRNEWRRHQERRGIDARQGRSPLESGPHRRGGDRVQQMLRGQRRCNRRHGRHRRVR